MELESKMYTKKLDLQEREDRHPKRSIEKQGGQLYLEFIKWPSVKYTALNSQSDTRSGQNCPDNCIRRSFKYFEFNGSALQSYRRSQLRSPTAQASLP